MGHIRVDLSNTNNKWVEFELANINTFIIRVGFVGAVGLDPGPLASRPLSTECHDSSPSYPPRKPNVGAQIRMSSHSRRRSWHSTDAIFPRGFI